MMLEARDSTHDELVTNGRAAQCTILQFTSPAGTDNASSLRPGRFCRLLDDVEFDLCDPAFNHPQRIGRRM